LLQIHHWRTVDVQLGAPLFPEVLCGDWQLLASRLQEFEDVHFLVSLDALGNHRKGVDLNCCLFETQSRVRTEFIGHHHPSQRQFAYQHISKHNAEALQFLRLRLAECVVVDQSLQN